MAKIIRMMCTIHDNSLTNNELRRIEKQTQQLYTQHFGRHFTIMPIWVRIPPGQAYLAGKPSSASAVVIPVADDLDNTSRHKFMKAFCDNWIAITGCNKNDIIFNAADSRYVNKLNRQMLSRIRPSIRPLVAGKLAFTLLMSKVSKGYLSTSINL